MIYVGDELHHSNSAHQKLNSIHLVKKRLDVTLI